MGSTRIQVLGRKRCIGFTNKISIYYNNNIVVVMVAIDSMKGIIDVIEVIFNGIGLTWRRLIMLNRK